MLLFVLVPFAALFLAMGAHPVGLIDTDDEIRARTETWRPLALIAATEAGVPVDLLLALVATESSGRPGAQSGSGAMGLTQLMPPTAKGAAARLPGMDPDGLDYFDPALNLRLGAAVLGGEMRTFNEDAALALAAYHRGAGEPAAWQREMKGRSGIEVVRERAPPVTRAYVERVLLRRRWFPAKRPGAEVPAPR